MSEAISGVCPSARNPACRFAHAGYALLRDINELVEKGVIKKDEGGGRSTSYSLNLQ